MTSTADRVRTLREAMGLTQTQVARQTGGEMDQGRVAKVENGRNKLSTRAAQLAMARGLGLAPHDFDAYLDGSLPLQAAVARAKGGASAARGEAPAVMHVSDIHLDRDPAPALHVDGTPLERALGEAFEPSVGHLVRDVTAVQRALGTDRRLESIEGDLVGAARRWIDAAMQLRKEGREVDAQELLIRVTVGKGAVAAAAHAERRAEHQAGVDAHAAEVEAGMGDELEPPDAEGLAKMKATAAKTAAKRAGRS